MEWILHLRILKIIKHLILINLSEKTNLKRTDKYVVLSNLSIHYTWKNIKVIQKK